jgi:hypothetical protein
MRTDFLAGARKKRLSWNPRGLLEAWLGLDAAAKVYVGTVIGLVVSVCSFFPLRLQVKFGHMTQI